MTRPAASPARACQARGLLALMSFLALSSALPTEGSPRRVVLRNRWVERVFEAGASWRTLAYRARGSQEALAVRSSTPDEGSVVAGGRRLRLGSSDADGLPLIRWSLSREGHDRRRLQVELGPGGPAAPGLVAMVTYDLLDQAPVLVKAVRLENRGSKVLRVDSLLLESFQPSGEGRHELMLVGAVELSPPLAIVLAPGASRDLPGLFCTEFVLPRGDEERRGLALRRAMRQAWPWTNQRVLSAGYRENVPPESAAALKHFADQAAEAGFQGLWVQHCGSTPTLFTNFADYELNPKLWPGGWEDVRAFTDGCHRRGLKVFFYVTHAAVWWNPGIAPPGMAENQVFRANRWNRVDAQGRALAPTRENPGNWTENACPASGWGPFLLRKVLETVDQGGFDGFDLDGPYDWWQYSDPGLLCWAKDHAHEPGGGSRLPAWENTVRIYQEARARRLFLPTAAGWPHLAAGASRMAGSGAYEGSDAAGRDPWEYAWWSRRQEYDMTLQWNTSQLCKGINVIPWLGGLSLSPLEQNADLYNVHLANGVGYGFDVMPSGNVLWEGPRSERVLKEWVRFYRAHERFFAEGDLLHVRRPDGVHLDAVAHVLSSPASETLVVVYNPQPGAQEDLLGIPFERLDLPPLQWRAETTGGAGTVEALPDGRVKAALPGRGVGWCVLHGRGARG